MECETAIATAAFLVLVMYAAGIPVIWGGPFPTPFHRFLVAAGLTVALIWLARRIL